MQLAVK